MQASKYNIPDAISTDNRRENKEVVTQTTTKVSTVKGWQKVAFAALIFGYVKILKQ